MKNRMKLAAAGIVAVLAVGIATIITSTGQAQPNPGGGLLSPTKVVASGGNWTSRIAGASAVTVGTRIDARAGQKLAIQAKGELSAAGTTTFTVALSRNVDGSTNREVFATIPITANGTTAVNTNSIFDIGGIPFVYVEYITNANGTGGTYLTNYAVWANVK